MWTRSTVTTTCWWWWGEILDRMCERISNVLEVLGPRWFLILPKPGLLGCTIPSSRQFLASAHSHRLQEFSRPTGPFAYLMDVCLCSFTAATF